MAQGASYARWRSHTYNILFPPQNHKETMKRKSTPVDACCSYIIVKIHNRLPFKIILHYQWKMTLTLNCFIWLPLSDLFKHRYNLLPISVQISVIRWVMLLLCAALCSRCAESALPSWSIDHHPVSRGSRSPSSAAVALGQILSSKLNTFFCK